jgi:tetratricopeptide (TPR) repeat protein
MNCTSLLIPTLLGLATACASTSPAQPTGPTAESELPAAQVQAFALGDVSVSPRDAVKGIESEQAHELDTNLAPLWREPAFLRRFAESYLAETDIEPRVTAEERDVLQNVATHIAAERFDKAIALLSKKGGPEASAVFDFTLGNVHFQREEFEEAALAYELAVQKYHKFRRAWKNLGLVHVRLSNNEESAEAFTNVIERGGGDALTYGLLGYSYTNLQKPLAAESAYRMAALLDPDALDWKLGLARSFFSQHRYADAATLCGELIAERPDSADLWLLQANAFIGLEQPLRAAENFEFVERLGKSTVASLNNLGDIYVNEKVFDIAVDAYVRALEMDEEGDVSRALRAAKSIAANGAFEDVHCLIDAVEAIHGDTLSPLERKELLKLAARIAVAEGQGTEEARLLEEVVVLDPLDGDALILLGLHAARNGDQERGIFYLERAANIAGVEAEAKRRHGQLLVNRERYAEALPLLRRSQTLSPSNALGDYIEQVERVAKTDKGKR